MDSKDLAVFIGNRISYYRKEKGWTQKELGDKIGVEHNTISDYERGIISPKQDILFALREIFEISLDDLFPSRSTQGK